MRTSATRESAFIWARVVGGADAVPFFALNTGERFKFKSSDAVFTKGKRGWYKDVAGRNWRTGMYTAVIRVG